MAHAERGETTARNTVPMPVRSTITMSPQPNTTHAVLPTGLHVSHISVFSTCCEHTIASTYHRTSAGGIESVCRPHNRMPHPICKNRTTEFVIDRSFADAASHSRFIIFCELATPDIETSVTESLVDDTVNSLGIPLFFSLSLRDLSNAPAQFVQ